MSYRKSGPTSGERSLSVANPAKVIRRGGVAYLGPSASALVSASTESGRRVDRASTEVETTSIGVEGSGAWSA
jgi:hypothetical protein